MNLLQVFVSCNHLLLKQIAFDRQADPVIIEGVRPIVRSKKSDKMISEGSRIWLCISVLRVAKFLDLRAHGLSVSSCFAFPDLLAGPVKAVMLGKPVVVRDSLQAFKLKVVKRVGLWHHAA